MCSWSRRRVGGAGCGPTCWPRRGRSGSGTGWRCCGTGRRGRAREGRWSRPGATYRSFISLSVFCGEQNLGMLSVDAPEPHAFDETDLNVMRAMAQLLAAGLVDRR
ncbi:MAG TPA: GAF domain-containing protein [Actinomycetes bacterium]|nr:GAF domain-containing protein [Actinomycetes bacterium]